MAAGNGSTQGTSSLAGQWSDLPDDLLSMVYIRLALPADLVHFTAVCASWRAAALMHPQPAPPRIPWLILDPRGGDEMKHLYCPQDGTVLPHVPLPSKAAGRCFIGGYDGGWVASSEAPLGIVNLFSGAEVALSTEQRRIVRERQCSGNLLVLQKVVFSEAPTSGGCILAAITDKLGIAICKIGCPERGWITQEFRGDERLMDIAFCNGELYGIMRHSDGLFKFEISLDGQGAPVRIDAHRLNMQSRSSYTGTEVYPKYIVELHGKLLMVEWSHWRWPRNNRSFFTVNELVNSNTDIDTHTYDFKWVEMTSLGNYTLFLGPTCSKAVHVPTGRRGSLKRNHIYNSHHRCLRRKDRIPDHGKLFHTSWDSNWDRVYYMIGGSTDSSEEEITSVRHYVRGGVRPPMWLLPPDM